MSGKRFSVHARRRDDAFTGFFAKALWGAKSPPQGAEFLAGEEIPGILMYPVE